MRFLRGFDDWECIRLENHRLDATMKDRMVWRPEKSAKFSIKPYYKVIQKSDEIRHVTYGKAIFHQEPISWCGKLGGAEL